MRKRLTLAALVALLPIAAMAQLIERQGPPGDQDRTEQPGEPARGRQLAEERCRSCHVVSPEQGASASDRAPSFMAIADRFEQSADKLLAQLLNAPHPPMPSPPLDRQQWRDVVAYMVSFGLSKPSHKPPEPGGDSEQPP